MADTGVFATTLQVQNKVGANASTVSNTEVYINDFMLQAESKINSDSRFNWSDVYSTLNIDVKSLLTLAASNLAATFVLNWDASGLGSREFETRLDVLKDSYDDAIKLLKDWKTRTYVEGA